MKSATQCGALAGVSRLNAQAKLTFIASVMPLSAVWYQVEGKNRQAEYAFVLKEHGCDARKLSLPSWISMLIRYFKGKYF